MPAYQKPKMHTITINEADKISRKLKNIYKVSNHPEINRGESINKYKYHFLDNSGWNELRNHDAKLLLFNLVECKNLKLNTEIRFRYDMTTRVFGFNPATLYPCQ